ncbi:cysteine hydrolase family protein [Proteiniclasticum sp. QWL-01]|uniref:cysteine hydrolase family protein n=1 Tax=Proteiniclasticum sp. QWL-01 TaxID=3036945 RepID=UPI002200B4DE|nr:cysteine hydrolase family protein [Proteiniclasticum sp. QWL-01]UUM11777.1 cysteine hydrolase family protein [Clostridiaceae bacterium HFYG-1003]WFF73264.1 cysteine hydrolase family protein [Proteiniclasticum sp. QWL-01]
MKKALIVVDYSYDFIATDGKLTCGEPGQAIESALVERIRQFVEQGDLVIFTMDVHEADDPCHPESRLFPPHNIRGTKGRELYGRVKDVYEQYQGKPSVHWFDKVRYSSFYGTPLDALLRSHGVDTVVITGVCTDICVLHTAFDAYNLSYRIEIPLSCVASFNPAGHQAALDHFKNSLGADLTE